MKGAVEEVKPWTEKHVHEAKAALYRLTAEDAASGDSERARGTASAVTWKSSTATLGGFVDALMRIEKPHVDAARILRTVRDRAEGREVVTIETFWRVGLANGRYEANDDDGPPGVSVEDAWRCAERHHAVSVMACEPGSRVVRVTLTRRRIVRATKGGS